MADSTSFIRPAVEAFKSGTLHMATGPTQGSVISYEWGEYPVNIALVVASVFFFLFFLIELCAGLEQIWQRHNSQMGVKVLVVNEIVSP